MSLKRACVVGNNVAARGWLECFSDEQLLAAFSVLYGRWLEIRHVVYAERLGLPGSVSVSGRLILQCLTIGSSTRVLFQKLGIDV